MGDLFSPPALKEKLLKEFFLKNPFQNFSFAKPSAPQIPASLFGTMSILYTSESGAKQDSRIKSLLTSQSLGEKEIVHRSEAKTLDGGRRANTIEKRGRCEKHLYRNGLHGRNNSISAVKRHKRQNGLLSGIFRPPATVKGDFLLQLWDVIKRSDFGIWISGFGKKESFFSSGVRNPNIGPRKSLRHFA